MGVSPNEASKASVGTNWAGRVVTSNWFIPASMTLILMNAVWIAFEIDHNTHAVLSDAPMGFQLMEHGFCIGFSVELFIRWLAFQRKFECIYDAWFRFDLVLVLLVVLETWLVPLGYEIVGVDATSGSQSLNKLSIFRLARLLRLSRLTRLLNAAPELAILLKGIAAALRSVMVTMLLLVCLLYVFGVTFRAQSKSHPELEALYFGSVPQSMYVLLLHGTMLDSLSSIVNELKEESIWLACLFGLFVFMSNLTVMNMLIGILCDVVARVKVEETERSDRIQLRNALREMMDCYDFNHNGMLEEKEFRLLMQNPDVVAILTKFGTDVPGLLLLSETAFADHTKMSKAGALCFEEFLDLVLRLKGDHSVRVTDVVEQREYVRSRLDKLESEWQTGHEEIKERLERLGQSIPKLLG